MKHTLYNIIQEGKANAKKALAILIDPDKLNNERLNQTIELAVKSKVDYFFVGGSLVVTDTLDTTVAAIKSSQLFQLFFSQVHPIKSRLRQMRFYTCL